MAGGDINSRLKYFLPFSALDSVLGRAATKTFKKEVKQARF